MTMRPRVKKTVSPRLNPLSLNPFRPTSTEYGCASFLGSSVDPGVGVGVGVSVGVGVGVIVGVGVGDVGSRIVFDWRFLFDPRRLVCFLPLSGLLRIAALLLGVPWVLLFC